MTELQEDSLRPPTGRHGLADVVAVHQRERLLAATVDLVAERGYRGTSIDHIVKTAKVGYAAFYELFENKEACLLEAFEQIAAEGREQICDAIAADARWPEQIATGMRTLVELIAAHPAAARLALVEVQAAGPAALTRYEETIDSAAPKLQEGRAFNPKAATLSETLEGTILGGIAWIIHQRLVKGEVDQIQGLAPVLIQIALSPYLGEADARRVAAGEP